MEALALRRPRVIASNSSSAPADSSQKPDERQASFTHAWRSSHVQAIAMRYQFVDCRWELGSPGKGRELYLAGHIPGASFLDVDEDLAAPPGQAGGTRCRARRTSPPRPPGPGSARASSSSPTGTWAAPSGSGGCSATSATTTAPCSSSTPGADRCARARSRRAGRVRPARARRRHDRAGGAGAAPGRARPRRRAPARALPRRAEPDRQTPGRIPGALSAPWAEPLPELPDGDLVAYCGSGVTACVTCTGSCSSGREGRLYPGSWSDWETRDLPVTRG